MALTASKLSETYSLTDNSICSASCFRATEAIGTARVWAPVRDVPEDFIDEVRRVITPEAPTQTAA